MLDSNQINDMRMGRLELNAVGFVSNAGIAESHVLGIVSIGN